MSRNNRRFPRPSLMKGGQSYQLDKSLSSGWRSWCPWHLSFRKWFIRWIILSNVWTTGAWTLTWTVLVKFFMFLYRKDLESLCPDFQAMTSAHSAGIVRGVIVTLQGTESNGCVDTTGEVYDFISRYFAPWRGVLEDPVTGEWRVKCPSCHRYRTRLTLVAVRLETGHNVVKNDVSVILRMLVSIELELDRFLKRVLAYRHWLAFRKK